MINVTKEAQDIAEEILNEHLTHSPGDGELKHYPDELIERAHEHADSHESVIYYSKAHELCRLNDTSAGEQYLEDCGGIQKDDTYDSIATKIAYGTLYCAITEELAEAWEARKNAA